MTAPASPSPHSNDPLARWIRAPVDPPETPPGNHEWARHFRPAESFLRYLKLTYLLTAGAIWLVAAPLLILATVSILMEMESSLAQGFLLVLVLGGLALPGLVGTLAGYRLLQLRFETTWYVLTDRALRVRRGILTIREQTVTLDNVQNVKVKQGPIQRWLGIANLSVETAAGGVATGQSGSTTASGTVLEGVGDAPELRDRIRDRMRQSRSQGIGDRDDRVGAGGSAGAGAGSSAGSGASAGTSAGTGARADAGARGSAGAHRTPVRSSPGASDGAGWSREHLAALREIHQEIRKL